jgi:hypothetical protein
MRRRVKCHRTHEIELLDAKIQQAVINVGEHGIGNMCHSCEYCNARYWGHKLNTLNKHTKWCHDRMVSLDPLSEAPALLRKLLTGDTQDANNHREHT